MQNQTNPNVIPTPPFPATFLPPYLFNGSTGINNNPNIQQRTALSNRLPELYQLLGKKTVILPVEIGKVRCEQSNAATLTFDDTQQPLFQAMLSAAPNHAVSLGKASEGLCTIVIEDDENIEPFLEKNPTLRNTLRTTNGEFGCRLWVKIEHDYPEKSFINFLSGEPWGEWNSDGEQAVISGLLSNGGEFKRIISVPPISIPFKEIIWPESLVVPWRKTAAELLAEHEGRAFERDQDGKVVGKLNEMYFVAKYLLEHPVIFEKESGQFYEYDWNDGLWKTKTAIEVTSSFERDMTAMAHGETNAWTQATLLQRREVKLFSQWTTSLKGRALKSEVFNNQQSAIHLKNGMLVLDSESPRLMSFGKDYYSRNQIPFSYDPDAECPQFTGKLLGSALDADDISLLQRWCGSVLLGKNSAQKIMMLTGIANSGKSTLLGVIESIIGRSNVASLRSEQLGQRFELTAFVGKTLLTAHEVSAKFMMQRGIHMLKGLVGNDYMEAERKGSDNRMGIYGTFNVGITCNSKLRIKLEGDRDAWLRRLIVIPYEKLRLTKNIANFSETLIREEGNGILRWMIDGAIAHMKELQDIGNFQMTETQNQRVIDLLDESDEAEKAFLERAVIQQKGATITSAELVDALRHWMPSSPLNDTALMRTLPGLMADVHGASVAHDIERDGKHLRGYNGFCLKQEVPDVAG